MVPNDYLDEVRFFLFSSKTTNNCSYLVTICQYKIFLHSIILILCSRIHQIRYLSLILSIFAFFFDCLFVYLFLAYIHTHTHSHAPIFFLCLYVGTLWSLFWLNPLNLSRHLVTESTDLEKFWCLCVSSNVHLSF